MNIGDLVAKLKIDKSGWDAAMAVSKKDLTGLETKSGKTAKGFKLNWLMVTAAIAGVGLALRKAMNVFGDFQQNMSDVSTLLDSSTMPLLGDMKSRLLEMATTLPKPIDDLGKALYQTISAGISPGANALKVLHSSTKLAVAGLGSTKEAVNIMTSSLNAYHLSVTDADAVSNIFFKAVKAGKTTVGELSQAFGSVAPIASEMGVKLDDLSAATAALTTAGVPTAEAQQNLRQAIASMLKPTEDMSILFKRIGVVDGKQLIETSGGLVGAFFKIKEEAGKTGMNLGKVYGRVQALTAAISLTGATNEIYNKTLADMRDGTDKVNEGVEKQNETFESAKIKFKNWTDTIMINLGDRLAPGFVKFMDLISKIPDIFSESLNLAYLTLREFLTNPEIFIAFSNMVVDILGGVILAIPKFISTALTPLIGFIDFIGEKIGVGIFNILQDVKSTINKWIDKMPLLSDDIKEKLKFDVYAKQSTRTASEAFDEMAATTKIQFEDTKNVIKDTFEVAAMDVQNLKDKLAENKDIKASQEEIKNILGETKQFSIDAGTDIVAQKKIESDDIVSIKKFEAEEIENIWGLQKEMKFGFFDEIVEKRKEMNLSAITEKEYEENRAIYDQWLLDYKAMSDSMSGSFSLGVASQINSWGTMTDQMRSQGSSFANGMVGVTKGMFDEMRKGGNAFKTFFKGMTDLLFDMLTEMVAKMLVKLALLKIFKISATGPLGALFHEGGVVEKYHAGGVIRKAHTGMIAQDEVPIIAQTGEAVLNRRATKQLGVQTVNDLNAGKGFNMDKIISAPLNIIIDSKKIATAMLEVSKYGMKIINQNGIYNG